MYLDSGGVGVVMFVFVFAVVELVGSRASVEDWQDASEIKR